MVDDIFIWCLIYMKLYLMILKSIVFMRLEIFVVVYCILSVKLIG